MDQDINEDRSEITLSTKKLWRPAKYKCKRCSRKFKDLRLLHDHLQVHRGKQETGKYNCKLCPELFSDFFEFIRHKKGHRNIEFKEKCQSSFIKEEGNGISAAFRSHEDAKAADLELPQNGRRGDLIKLHGIEQAYQKGAADEDSHHLNFLEPADHSRSNNIISPGSQSSILSGPFSENGDKRGFESHLKMVSNDVLQIDSSSPLRSIQFNTSSPDITTILNQIKAVNNKLDAIIRHFNVPLDISEPSDLATPCRRPRASKLQKLSIPMGEDNFESIPPCCNISKDQSSQGFLSTPVASSGLKPWALNASPTMYNTPGSQTMSKDVSEAESPKADEEALSSVTSVTSSLIKSSSAALRNCMLTEEQIEKLYVISRSRGNFAKNLTFAVYSPEERHGRNCTGRVFGKAIPKGQLDPTKLNYVKELTFQKYPCHPSLIDFTWKKKCVTAIDSGLRNENRVRSRRLGSLRGDAGHSF